MRRSYTCVHAYMRRYMCTCTQVRLTTPTQLLHLTSHHTYLHTPTTRLPAAPCFTVIVIVTGTATISHCSSTPSPDPLPPKPHVSTHIITHPHMHCLAVPFPPAHTLTCPSHPRCRTHRRPCMFPGLAGVAGSEPAPGGAQAAVERCLALHGPHGPRLALC